MRFLRFMGRYYALAVRRHIGPWFATFLLAAYAPALWILREPVGQSMLDLLNGLEPAPLFTTRVIEIHHHHYRDGEGGE